mgnify:FL=1
MNSNNNMIELQMELPIEHEKKVFGQFDEHIKILERSLAVTLISRDGVLKIVGPASNAARAKECLTQLLELSRRGNDINTQNVNYAISLVMEDSGSSLAEIDSDCICTRSQAVRSNRKHSVRKRTWMRFGKRWSSSASALPEPEKHTLQWRWRSPRSETMK